MGRNYDVITNSSKCFYFKKTYIANFADIIKIPIMFIKKNL